MNLERSNDNFLIKNNTNRNNANEKILCSYCKRSKNNGLYCIGKCVSESEY